MLQVRNPAQVHAQFEDHKARLQQRGHVNEARRFHGTSLAPHCSFGIDGTQPPCTDPHCSVCTICATSFDVSLAAANTGFSRCDPNYMIAK